MPTLNAAKGLVTSSNELNRPEGALTVADNIIIDFDNTIQSRRGFEEYSSVQFSSPVKQLFTYKNKILAHYAETLSFDTTSTGVFANFNGTFSELVSGLRVKAVEANGNFYFTSSNGIKKISAKNASELTSATITNAGGIKAIDLQGKVVPDNAGFLPPQSKVAYRLVYGTKDNNSNLILGYPSSRVVLTNNANDSAQSEVFTVNFLDYSTIVDSDYILFDTPTKGYCVYFDKTGTATAPINGDTLDREAVKVNIQSAASNTDASALFANQLQTELGDVLSIELSGSEVEITITETGDALDASQGSLLASEVLITKVIDGSVTSGVPSLAELTFTLPQNLSTNYFYQVYRTAVVSIEPNLTTLSDIDPGDEQQFVYEAPITSADLTAGEITITDNTPETFRASGAYLMTNAFSGGGITQANERPPIATDIALFRNSTFYSNTKEVHRLNLTMLSVDDFVSESTKFYLKHGSTTSIYTFVGVAGQTDVTVKKKSETVGNSYFTLSGPENKREYYFWADKGPINHSFNATTAVNDATDEITITAHGFSSGDPVTFTGTEIGTSENIIGPTFYVEVVDVNTIKLSSSVFMFPTVEIAPAVGTTIISHTPKDPNVTGKTGVRLALELYDDTLDGSKECLIDALFSTVDFEGAIQASDVVRVTCTDSGSVNAPTTTGSWSVAISTIGKGEDTAAREVLLSKSSSLATAIDLTARSLVKVINKDLSCPVFAQYLSGADDLPGKIIFEAKDLADIDFYAAISSSSLTAEFSPELPVWDEIATFPITVISDNNENPHRIYFSKTSQPEAVPIVNYIDVGSKDKQILRILALRDNLFVLKQDGVYIVTGASAPDFSVRLLDNSAILTAPDSAVVLNNLIYCLTTQGIVSISETGVSIISRQIEDQIKKVTTFAYNFQYISYGVAYESDRSYLLWLPTSKSDTVATQCFRFNTITNTWTRWTKSNTCGIVNPTDDRLYLGSGTSRQFVEQERKNGERQDYADRSFKRSIGVDAIAGLTINVSSIVDIETGDVITQEQYVTVPKFNRLLAKLDRDTGPTDKNYKETLRAKAGDNLASALSNVVIKLNADPQLFGAFTVPSGINTTAALKADYNLLITELNNSSSGTVLKTYKPVTDLITYEVLVKSVSKAGNTVDVNFVPWLIQGEIRVYKGIHVEVEWAPQHFGSPETTKQIDKGTLIFDQGTIYGGTIAYSSDRSADFAEVAFEMSGPGFWASFPWLDSVWGGSSNEVPVITLIPRDKSRCRYMHVKFKHVNAREQFKLLGISLEPREVSKRGYR